TGSQGFSAFSGVVVLGGEAAWAVGYRLNSTGHYRTLAERWDGTRWRILPTPNPGPGDNAFTAVGGDAANGLWAVGYQTSGGVTAPLIERWDGAAWSVVPGDDVA